MTREETAELIQQAYTEEQLEVMKAYAEGKHIEAAYVQLDGSVREFESCEEPAWFWEACIYRVVEPKLEIPWHLIKEEYVWAAMDENGGIYIYSEQPEEYSTWWYLDDGDQQSIKFLKIETNGIKWDKSLTKRP